MSTHTIGIDATAHSVKSVVVLKSSKAEVVRTFTVELQAGQNRLVISKLPSTIDTQSVRISGLNSGGPRANNYLSDVVCSVSESSEDTSTAIIDTLEAQKQILTREKNVLDVQSAVLVKYANSLSGEHASPDIMTNFLASFVDHGKSNLQSVAKLEAEIKQIEKQIKAETKKVSALKGSANTELTAVIVTDHDNAIELKLTYIVDKTKWSPTYELHAVTGDDGQPSRTVSLEYRACITQSTGEDWTDAALTLSTVATDAIVKQIPKLDPVKINVTYLHRPNPFPGQHQSNVVLRSAQQPQQTQQTRSPFTTTNTLSSTVTTTLFGQSAAPTASGPSLFGSPAAPPPAFSFGASAPAPSAPPPIISQPEDDPTSDDEQEAPAKLVTQTPMALTYSVRGRSSIPSDGKEHVVIIAVLSFEADIEYISVPRIDPRVYLQCEVKNNSEYRLLPGPVSIILDDSYVSKTTISDVNRNDVFNFTLGDDPSVLISYSRESKTIKEGQGSFADTANITTYTTSITVQNKHAFSIEKLALRDALPVSNDSRVRVVLRQPKELFEAREGVFVKIKKPTEVADASDEENEECLKVKWTKEKEGLYEYRWRVDPDDKIKLQTVFETRSSSDLVCTFLEPNFGPTQK